MWLAEVNAVPNHPPLSAGPGDPPHLGDDIVDWQDLGEPSLRAVELVAVADPNGQVRDHAFELSPVLRLVGPPSGALSCHRDERLIGIWMGLPPVELTPCL